MSHQHHTTATFNHNYHPQGEHVFVQQGKTQHPAQLFLPFEAKGEQMAWIKWSTSGHNELVSVNDISFPPDSTSVRRCRRQHGQSSSPSPLEGTCKSKRLTR
jgi:hypothetical protein